jgi:hypothetical protein
VEKAIWQLEIGESGTLHLQGTVCFTAKKRPTGVFQFTKAPHWESCRDLRASITYCSKESGLPFAYRFVVGMPSPRPSSVISALRPWQTELWGVLQSEPDPRSIHWWWEPSGGVGKTSFTKYIITQMRGDSVVLSGKGADVFHGLAKFHEVHGQLPKVIIYDVPRSSLEYVSYQALEKVKDACFFSGKYETAMICDPFHPHVIVFANDEPNYEKMSADRWKVKRII